MTDFGEISNDKECIYQWIRTHWPDYLARALKAQSKDPAPDIQIVGFNDLVPAAMSAYLLKYDTAYGPLDLDVQSRENAIIVGDKEIPYFMEKDPMKVPEAKLGTDVVIESTGVFRRRELRST